MNSFIELFKRRTPTVRQQQEDIEQELLGEEHAVVGVDFDQILQDVKKLSKNAQATFCFRLVGMLPQSVVRSLKDYVLNRLNGKDINIRQGFRHPDRKTSRGDGNIGQP